jgi:hypothetical protein
MIKLEFISSPDQTIIGEYDYLFDEVYIGRSKKCDLIFLESEFPLIFLTLIVNESFLVVQSAPNSPSFFVNSKKISGICKLKLNDEIRFGNHIFRIINFKKSNSKTDLTAFYENIPNTPAKVQDILSTLEEMILIEETESNV